jgi:hypothetical protein
MTQRGLQPQPMVNHESHGFNECLRASCQRARAIEPADVVSDIEWNLFRSSGAKGIRNLRWVSDPSHLLFPPPRTGGISVNQILSNSALKSSIPLALTLSGLLS